MGSAQRLCGSDCMPIVLHPLRHLQHLSAAASSSWRPNRALPACMPACEQVMLAAVMVTHKVH